MATKQTTLPAANGPVRATKRIIVVGGDKGGVGKSFVARALLHYLREINVDVLAVDTDPSNATFASFLRGKLPCELVNIDVETALDTLFNKVLEHGTVLVDFAARAHERFAKWVEDVDLGSLQKGYGVELTMFFVLGGEPESVAILNDVYQKTATDTHLVIVRNMGRTENFKFYENHPVRAAVLDRGAAEIEIPELASHLAQLLAQRKLLFHEAMDKQLPDPLTPMDQNRASRFTKLAAEQFDQVGEFLN